MRSPRSVDHFDADHELRALIRRYLAAQVAHLPEPLPPGDRPEVDRLAYSVDGAASTLGVDRSYIYRLLETGELTAKKLGRRTVILGTELRRFLDALPVAEFGESA